MEDTEQAKNLAALVSKQKKLEDHKKVTNREFLDKRKQLRGEIEELAENINAGQGSLL